MTAHELLFLLIIGFVSVAAWPLYVAGEKVICWILNGAERTCPTCDGTGLLRDSAGLYWRCTACEGRGDVAVLA